MAAPVEGWTAQPAGPASHDVPASLGAKETSPLITAAVPAEAAALTEEKMIKAGRTVILDHIRNNEAYTQSAEQAAEQIFTALIRGMNPDRDLHVVIKIGEED